MDMAAVSEAYTGLKFAKDVRQGVLKANIALNLRPPDPAHLRAEVAKTERPAAAATGKAIPSAVSTKSAQSSSATVESEERVR
jgi:hypothetical protein